MLWTDFDDGQIKAQIWKGSIAFFNGARFC